MPSRKRVVRSPTPSDAEDDDVDALMDDDDDGGDEDVFDEGDEDAEGEEEGGEEDAEGEEDDADVVTASRAAPSVMEIDELADDDAEGEPDGDDDGGSVAPPARGLKIKLNMSSAHKSTGAKKRRRSSVDGHDDDEFDDGASGRASPSKMTARQRSRQNKDLSDGLLSLPNDNLPKKPEPVLTEAERLGRREENARRRRRQNEQRLQDEQDQTINRLLRAQTTRSRSKLDADESAPASASAGGSGAASPTKGARRRAAPPGAVRVVSRVVDGNLEVRVAADPDTLALPAAPRAYGGKGDATCAVHGCARARKYRLPKRFEVGACGIEHLKALEAQVDVVS
ncbi:hypothetical protein Q5752_006695 [Cryptotrichosporon argae]